MVFWKIAYRNVKKNWRHSVSALLSLSASFISLVLFDGYIDDLKKMYEDSFRHRSMLGDLIVEKPEIHNKAGLAEPWKYSLTEEEQGEIDLFLKQNQNLVRQRVRFVNFQGLISNGDQSAIVLGRGIDVKEGEQVRGPNWSWNTTLGVPLHRSEVPWATLLGQGLSKKLGCSWNSEKGVYAFKGGYEAKDRPFECPVKNMQISVMTDQGQLNALDLNVVGLLDAGYRDIDDRYLITSLETAQTLTHSKNVTMLSVELQNAKDMKKFITLFNGKFSVNRPDIKIMNWIDHPVGETYLKTMDLLAVFRNFVVIVILIISTLSVVNTLIKIIKERSREIGTIRSIGFRPMEVMQMFFYETFLLALLGTGIGFVLSLLLTLALNSAHIRYKAGMLSEPVLFQINFSLSCYLNAFAVLIFVSLGACFFSTRNELKKKVVENLSHV